MSRRALLISLAVLLFLGISAGLARFLSAENVERDTVLALLQDEVRGDRAAMLARLQACSGTCRTDVAQDAASLQGHGELKILNTDSHTAYSLTGASGQTRVAWKQGSRLPVVQCVLVRRTGDIVTGISVNVLAVGRPIPGTADCR